MTNVQNDCCVQVARELTRSREQASATGDPCVDTSPGALLLLFKITVAVAAENQHGQRIERVAGVSLSCLFTDT